MLRYGGAVIPMRPNFSGVDYLIGDASFLNNACHVPALPIFSEQVLNFLGQLSKELMHEGQARRYPDVISYAFWIRKGNMELLRKGYGKEIQRMGRGVAFQIAPSNIPVQFAVSMTYALIAGNISIVRMSNKNFEQTDIICSCIKRLLDTTYADMRDYICIIRYGHDDEITQALSDICDVRMIWGGDDSIAAIRKTSIPARCIDLGFADRYSIAVFDADVLLTKDLEVIANDFYNDTYFVDQNACSSPRMLIWIGERIAKARTEFWNAVERLVKDKYDMDPICSSEKLLKTAVFSAAHPDSVQIKNDNLLVRMEVGTIQDDIMAYKGNSGYFFEYAAKSLEEIVPLMKKECQTIICIGDMEGQLRALIENYGVRGVDRIVPVGHGTDISVVWDGLDLPVVLSRQIGNS